MDSEVPEGQQEISLSVEDTNILRAQLGLKPLDTSGSDHQKKAEDNFAQYKADQAKQKREKELADRIAKARDKRKLHSKLTGKHLGEADEEDITDPMKWIERQKQLAAQRAKEMDELDELELSNGAAKEKKVKKKTPQPDYSGRDLSGLKVGHRLEDIAENGEVIMTLKDRGVLDENDDDELVNVDLMDKDKVRENLEAKKKKTAYNAYDDEEFDTGVIGKRSILSQYDDEIGGKKKQGFVISAGGEISLQSEKKKQEVSEKMKAQAVALSYDKMKEVRDYYTQEELVAFKKPKEKKKKKRVRKRTTETENLESQENGGSVGNGDAMEEDQPESATVSKYQYSNAASTTTDMSFVDDDDLQSALARARRLAVKKEKKAKSSVEAIADALHLQQNESTVEGAGISAEDLLYRVGASANADDADEEEEDTGLVFDDTTEFVRSLPSASDMLTRAQENIEKLRDAGTRGGTETVKPGVAMKKRRDSREEDEMDLDEDVKVKQEDDDTNLGAGIEEEPVVSHGLAATLKLLKQKGYLEQRTAEDIERERKMQDREKWLIEQRKLEKLRELETKDGKNQMSKSRYELERKEREKARELEMRFRDYQPVVNLKYTDETGNELTAKQAFKQLSHKFHGKAPGKNKVERKLKKLEEEKRRLNMSSTDTPLGMSNALVEKQKQLGTAHLVLSVGNRGVVQGSFITSSSGTGSSIRETSAAASKSTLESEPIGSIESTGRSQIIQSAPPLDVNREKVAFGLAAGVKRKGTEGESEVNGQGNKRHKGE
ncbi:SART-1 protein [Paraphysoderma sedebokerense]|nr:SART-1 protein [Paraphysoderma sedebokerense]